MTHARLALGALLGTALLGTGALAACASAPPPARPASRASAAATGGGPTASATATKPPARPRAVLRHIRMPDGNRVTLALFRGPVRYVLHSGSQDPGTGLASLVIDRSGQASIGVWGKGLPRPGEAVFSVRQNLTPLVARGRIRPAARHWARWGATITGGEFVARSAVGENSAGNLIYAGSMSASPADLAGALVRAGARVAMELDINPEWVQLDTARKAGGRLRAAIPGQVRPANQYLAGWRRDFFAVVAAP